MIEKFLKYPPGDPKNDDPENAPFLAEIYNDKLLGSGGYANVYRTPVPTKHKMAPPGQAWFAIKRYNEPEEAKSALLAYTQLRRAGCKVFRTFRISENGLDILMTLGTHADQVMVSINNNPTCIEYLGVRKMTDIKNFNSLIQELEDNARLAAEAGLVIPSDTYFFYTDRQNPKQSIPREVGFVTGDLEALISISQNHPNEDKFSINSFMSKSNPL